MNEKVTWLLPTLNAEKYLAETLTSVATQTYKNHQIIAWDNGSSDSTVELLLKWIPSKIPGRVVHTQPFNLLGDCLAALVEAADTEYIARIDADDIALPNRLQSQLSMFHSNPNIGLVAGRAKRIDSNGKQVSGILGRACEAEEVPYAFLLGNPIVHPSILAKRSVVLEAGNYASLGMGQDLDLWYRVTMQSQIIISNKIVLKYRVHENSIGVNNRHKWAPLQYELWENYSSKLFPQLSKEKIMLIWLAANPLASELPETYFSKFSREKAVDAYNELIETMRNIGSNKHLVLSKIHREIKRRVKGEKSKALVFQFIDQFRDLIIRAVIR